MNVRTWTDRDAKTLRALLDFEREWGLFPNYRAIAAAIGVTSTNAVRDRLRRLEAHGVLEQVQPPHMQKCWRLTGQRPGAAPRVKTL